MYINKQRNEFVTEKYTQIAGEFEKLLSPDLFVGDDMIVHNCNKIFMQDAGFKRTFDEVALSPIYKPT